MTVHTIDPRFTRPRPKTGSLEVALPERHQTLTQDTEWCVVEVNGTWRRIRFHDYDELFAVPGLYEKVIYEILQCDSPTTICSMLDAALRDQGESPRTLRVLDLGAGNGMVGEQLTRLGAGFIVGVDILEEAAEATRRDRPGVYDDYRVADLTQFTRAQRNAWSHDRFNCLTCVAALGFGDIPIEAFVTAYNLIDPNGWIAFNIKAEFLEDHDRSGFARLIHSMVDAGALDIHQEQRYRHRLGTDRHPIYYVGFVGRKRGDAALGPVS